MLHNPKPAGQRCSHSDLKPTRRLKHNQRRGQLTQITGQLFQTFAVPLGCEGPT